MASKFVLVKHLHSFLNGDRTVLDYFVQEGTDRNCDLLDLISKSNRLVDIGGQTHRIRCSAKPQTFNLLLNGIPDYAIGIFNCLRMSYLESLMFLQQHNAMISC